jgi:hypothetical protein
LSLPDLIEAAARSDELDYAASVLAPLETRVAAAPTPSGRGLLARSGAMLAGGDHGDALHRDAISSLQDASMPLDEARAHLIYGECEHWPFLLDYEKQTSRPFPVIRLAPSSSPAESAASETGQNCQLAGAPMLWRAGRCAL